MFSMSSLQRLQRRLRPTFWVLLSCVVLDINVIGATTTSAAATAHSSSDPLPLRPLANKEVCIVGAGPCGLFLASQLLRQEPTVRVRVVERTPRSGSLDDKAFGFGVGRRMQRCLEAGGGGDRNGSLARRVEAVSAPISNRSDLRIVRRTELCDVLLNHLEENYGDRIAFDFGVEVTAVDLQSRELYLTKSSSSSSTSPVSSPGESETPAEDKEKGDMVVSYHLLVGADGINSSVRRMLVERQVVREEHYLHGPVRWKALRLPPQEDIEPGAFQPLAHPDEGTISGGAVLPRYPDGHTVLMFWRSREDQDDSDGNTTTNNPGGIRTAEELREAVTAAIRGELPRTAFYRRLTWNTRSSQKKTVNIVFDDDEVERFLKCRPGREHFMKLDTYHDSNSSVVLLGDAAHGMYSMLAQGCACGFESVLLLSKCLAEHDDLPSSLDAYSREAVPEGHAATDLNLISHATGRGGITKLLAMPILLVQAKRGGILYKRVNDPVKYQEVLRENKLVHSLARRVWKRQRQPYEYRSSEIALIGRSCEV